MLNGYRTLAATGRILGVSAQRVLDFIEHGPLVGRRLDGELKVHAEDLAAFRRPLGIATTSNNSSQHSSETCPVAAVEGVAAFVDDAARIIRPCGEPGFQARRGTMASKSYRALLDLSAVEAARERFSRFVFVEPNTGCSIFAGSSTADGYGTFRCSGVNVMAHRFAFVLAHGVIPERHDVDHTCHRRWCVDGAHLEAVSHAENIRRRDAGGKDNCVAARAALAAGRHLRLVQTSARGAP